MIKINSLTEVDRLKDLYCKIHDDIYGNAGYEVYSADLSVDQLNEMIDSLVEESVEIQAMEAERESNF